ncbi:IclR family transcriptional regulator [Burkholderia pseudomallei]|uniref:IclR family transcriptional regulator n=1 Tax=Burkholderia pseudomallei TaxID=28450 RepID=UPI000A1A11BC|nr:IclR family transcriptional regulator [Burkholderia pseudomallei]ARL91328.1 IclR family transcriptional regulator [Burkholderia pseudomallei]MBH9657978.1 IclR family transcriptional regulator [Burkholderia pseudomallei]NRD85794.1 IclR family transcriptional regulator [Burkholderia pseudomallei]
MAAPRIPSADAVASPSTSPDGVAALDRAFAILFAFRPEDKGLSLADLANRTGLYKSTILRLIASLTHHRMLLRSDDGRYYVGPAALQLGALYQRGLQLSDVVLPLMTMLRDLSGESVSFYVRQGNLRVCLYRVDSTHAIRDHVREGDVLPMDKGSGGRVLTAFSGARGALYDRIRKDAYYISVGERDEETAGISTPVFSADQLAGAFTLAGPRSRVDEALMLKMRKPMIEASIEASEKLGGDSAVLHAALTAQKPGKTRIKMR